MTRIPRPLRRLRRLRRLAVAGTALALVAGGLTACGGDNDASSGPVTLTLVTHDSFAYTESVLQQFTTDTGIQVKVAKGADAGAVVNRAILTKGNPEGDVLWGVDNTLLSRASKEKLFDPYVSKVLTDAAPDAGALGNGDVTPVDSGDVCINADAAALQQKGVPMPSSLADLTDPKYKDLLVVENPATSSPGLAFLLATVAEFGEPGWKDYWKALRANGVEVVDGWTQAYTVQFSGSSGKGPKPLVVSYATSPVAELVFADPKPAAPPTATMTTGCFHQIEYAGVLKGTKHRDAARTLVDFLVSKAFQEDMPLNMFVLPVRPDTSVPPEFTQFVPKVTGKTLTPDQIDQGRDAWIDQWTTVVLR